MTGAQGFGRSNLYPITTNGVQIIHPAITEGNNDKQILGAEIACSTNDEYMGYMMDFTGVTANANVYKALWNNIAGPGNPIKIRDWDRFLKLCNSHEFISRSWLMCIVLTLLNGDGTGFRYLIDALGKNPGDDGMRVYNAFLKGAAGGNQYAAFMTPGKHLRDACSAESALPVITQSCTNWLKQSQVIKGGMIKKKKQKIKSQSGGVNEQIDVQSANKALHWVRIRLNDPDITTAGSKLVGTVQANKKYKGVYGNTSPPDINSFYKAVCGICWICGRDVYTYKYLDSAGFELILNPQCGHMEHVVPPGLGNMLGILQNSRNTSLKGRTPLTDRLAYGMRISHAACNVIKLNITFINFPTDTNPVYTVNDTNVISFILKLDKFLRSDSKPKSPEFDSFFNPAWFKADHPGHQERHRVAFFQGVEQNTFDYLRKVVGMLNDTGDDLVRVQSAKMRSINNLLGMFNYKLPSYPIDATNPFSFFSYQQNSKILGTGPTVLAGGGKYVKRGGGNEIQDYYEIVQSLLQLSDSKAKTMSLENIKVIHYQLVLRAIVNFILQFGDKIFFIGCQNLEDPDYKLFYTKIESGLELLHVPDIEESFIQHYGDTRLIIAQLLIDSGEHVHESFSDEQLANNLRNYLFNLVDEENIQMQQEKKKLEDFMIDYKVQSAIIALLALRKIDEDEDIEHASKIANFMEKTGYTNAAVVKNALELADWQVDGAILNAFAIKTGNLDEVIDSYEEEAKRAAYEAILREALGASEENFENAAKFIVIKYYGAPHTPLVIQALKASGGNIEDAVKILKFIDQTGYSDAAVIAKALASEGNIDDAKVKLFVDQTGEQDEDKVREALKANGGNFEKAAFAIFKKTTIKTTDNVVREALGASGLNFKNATAYIVINHYGAPDNIPLVFHALEESEGDFEIAAEYANKLVEDFKTQTGYRDEATVREALGASGGNFENAVAFIVIKYYGAPDNTPLVIQSLEASGGNFEYASKIANFMAQTRYTNAAVVREALDANEGNFENAEAYIVIKYYGAPDNTPLVIQSLEASGGNFEYASSIAKEALEASGGNFENAEAYIVINHYGAPDDIPLVIQSLEASGGNFEYASSIAKEALEASGGNFEYARIIANIMAQTGYQDAAVVGKALEANEWDYNEALKFLETHTSRGKFLGTKKTPINTNDRDRQQSRQQKYYNNRTRRPHEIKTVEKLASVASTRRKNKFAQRRRTGTGGSRKKKRNIKKEKNSKKKQQKKLIKKSKKLITRKKIKKN